MLVSHIPTQFVEIYEHNIIGISRANSTIRSYRAVAADRFRATTISCGLFFLSSYN